MIKKLTLLFFAGFILVLLVFILANWTNVPVHVLFSEPLYFYSVLLFLLAFICCLISIYKTDALPVSAFLLPIFLMGPIIGPWIYREYLGRGGSLLGLGEISFAYPTFVWAVGTAVFFAGALLSHISIKPPNPRYIVLWDYTRLRFFLWVTFGLSLFFTILALIKIGYVPVIAGNILDKRVDYAGLVGYYVLRFSKLWVIAGIFSSMLFFLKNRKKVYLFVTMISVFGMMIYGQRKPGLIILISFILIYLKFYRPKKKQLILMGVGAIIVFFTLIFMANIRSGEQNTKKSLSEYISQGFFVEWMYYAVVVHETKSESDYLGNKIFLGQIAPLVPRQLFWPFGYDKEEVIKKYTAAYYYGELFGQEYGMRITPIGEAYAGYGILGVVGQLLVFGIIFGALDKIYLGLRREDARLCFISFLIAIMSDLPIGMVFMILSPLTAYGIFFIVLQLIGAKKFLINSIPAQEIDRFPFSKMR